ncbi:MAG: hypothetical protein J7578_02720 [Chitinophagaceae bacterium]|nr:hypothetical protein [Chitinophagaceae bacterium]
MHRKMYLLLLISHMAVAVSAQKPSSYAFPQEIQQTLSKDSTPWKAQRASWEFSFIGEYQTSLSMADSNYKFKKKLPVLAPEALKDLSRYKPVNARQYILDRADKGSIIIINEAHYQPLHRVFTSSLLKGLYEKGYRYLGLEALYGMDSMLNQRGYPVDSTGYYTKEPQFGNLIREALQTGFTIFGYEADDEDMNNNKREYGQAKHLAAYMKQYPGKWLIHCGYGHLMEKEHASFGLAMAGQLKQLTGIDPFTINQDALTEHSAPLYEQPEYQHIKAAWPAILIDEKGEPYNGYGDDRYYDIRMFHPHSSFTHGRPSWLYTMLPGRKAVRVPVNKLTIGFPVLAFAWPENEDIETAIPVDIMLLTSEQDSKAFALKAGRYRILLRNLQGKELDWQQIVE